MPTIFNIYEAKTHFSRLIERASRGEDIVIARDGVPVVRLTPITPTHGVRRPAGAFNLAHLSEAFDAPDPADARAFGLTD
jgi:prevent-host-death family protein